MANPATLVMLIALSLCLSAAGWGAGLQLPTWAALPYPVSPLVQSGGGNLLPTLDSTSLKANWSPRGDASLEQQDGAAALRLGASGSSGGIHVSADVLPERLYEVDFEFRFSSDAVLQNSPEPGADNRGLAGWVTPEGDDHRNAGSYEVRERRLLPGWQRHHGYIYAISGMKRVSIALDFNGSRGCVYLRDISLREVKVEAGAGLHVIHAPDGGWAERPRQSEPPPPAELVLYHRRDPDRLFFYSAPTPEERRQVIELNSTPGEVVIAAVGLFATKSLSSVKLSLSDLKSEDGAALASGFEWFQIHYQPRKSDYYGRGRIFSIVADAFLSRPGGVSAPAGKTTAFWLRLTIPPNARAGIYRGELRAEAGGRTLSLPVQVTVLPFPLVDPVDRTWGLYADSWRWSQRTDSQVLRELLEIKSHGIESLLLDFDKGSPIWTGDQITGWTITKEAERSMALLQRAGLRGPFLIEWWREEHDYAAKLGIPEKALEQHADKWPPQLGTAYRQAIQTFDAAWKRQGWGDWVYVGIDEPGYWKEGSPEEFRFEYDAAEAAGIKSYCTSSDLPSDPIGRPLTYHCAGDIFVESPEVAKRFLDEGKQYGQNIWFYATGSYSGQVGNVYANRYIAGLLFYKSGASGEVSWTFQRPLSDNAFDDFQRELAQPCTTLPDPEHPGENLDTPQWEGLRQAWYDYRYAATLAQEIERAKRDPRRAELASRVERDFASLLAEAPWSPRGSSAPMVNNTICDAWRARVAQLILTLASDRPSVLDSRTPGQ